jgi:hypothetical protein
MMPSLWNGLVLDDWWHRRMILEGTGMMGNPKHALDLFSFFADDPVLRAQLIEEGVWPWWGSGRVHVQFFRPITALTHQLDYAVWPDQPVLMHLHSLVWHAALVVAATALLRRLLEPHIAGLAALMYALCDGHALATSWLASRSAVVAAFCSVLALIAHDRWRRDGWKLGAWLAPLLFIVSLGAAELAIGALGYLLIHALTFDRRRPWVLVPYLAIAVAWQLAYRALGYGASGVGIYSDPGGDPLGFVVDLTTRAPVLLFSGFIAPLADGWPFMTRTLGLWTAGGAALGSAALAVLAWRALAKDRSARLLLFGSCIALVPAAAVVPSDRVLMLFGVGAAGALATFISRAELDESKLVRGVALALLVRHTLGGAILTPTRSLVPRVFARSIEAASQSAPDDPALAGETLVIVNAPHVFYSNMLPLVRSQLGGTLPARLRVLGTTTRPVSIERPSAGELRLRVEGGYLDRPGDELSWSRSYPRSAGFTLELSDMRFEVLQATADGRPEEIAVKFGSGPRPLRWITWSAGGYRAFELPPVGGSLRLEPIGALEALR